MHVRWSVNAKYGLLQKSALISNGDCCVQNFSILLQTGFKRILKGWKCVPQKHCMILIVRSKGTINLNFWMKFRKCNILQFPTHGHPWDRLLCDLHEKL